MSPEFVDVLLLAGGLGTRLRSVVSDRPKVLAPVAGEPYLSHLLRYLSRQGFRRVILLVGYLSHHVQFTYGERYSSLQLEYSVEEFPLGTGGALRHALPLIQSQRVLILNGDSFCDADYSRLLHSDHPQMLVTFVESAGRYGAITVDQDNRIRSFSEKNHSDLPGYINAGVYSFSTNLLHSIPVHTPYSLEHQLFPFLVAQGHLFASYGGRFIDIGTPESYQSAQSFFAEFDHAPAL